MPKEAATSSRATRAKKAEKPAARSKGKKDPGAPKRPLSAYMFFSQDWRERVKEENPKATFGQLGKLLGEKWKGMSDAEKKPYNDKAAADKKRADDEKAAYDSKAQASGSGEEDEEDE